MAYQDKKVGFFREEYVQTRFSEWLPRLEEIWDDEAIKTSFAGAMQEWHSFTKALDLSSRSDFLAFCANRRKNGDVIVFKELRYKGTPQRHKSSMCGIAEYKPLGGGDAVLTWFGIVPVYQGLGYSRAMLNLLCRPVLYNRRLFNIYTATDSERFRDYLLKSDFVLETDKVKIQEVSAIRQGQYCLVKKMAPVVYQLVAGKKRPSRSKEEPYEPSLRQSWDTLAEDF